MVYDIVLPTLINVYLNFNFHVMGFQAVNIRYACPTSGWSWAVSLWPVILVISRCDAAVLAALNCCNLTFQKSQEYHLRETWRVGGLYDICMQCRVFSKNPNVFPPKKETATIHSVIKRRLENPQINGSFWEDHLYIPFSSKPRLMTPEDI